MVSVVLDCLVAGMSEQDILAEYPTLTVEGVRAAAAYGAALAREIEENEQWSGRNESS
jgi:uncharacterized protein (DUF433 family)